MSTSTPTRRAYIDRPWILVALALLSSCEHGVPRYVGSTGTRSTTLVLTPDGGVQSLDAAVVEPDALTNVTAVDGGGRAAAEGASRLAIPADEPLPERSQTGPDRELELKIERNLRQDPLVPAGSVDVDVRNGIATIRGRVPSWQAYKAAMDDVANAQPFRVVDDLKVGTRRE